MNSLKSISIGALFLLLAGCAAPNPYKRKPDKPWYKPDVDADDRAFFYDPFFGKSN